MLLTTAVTAVLLTTGCAGRPPQPAAAPAAPSAAAATRDAVVYAQVLRHYLGTPTENSFPDKTFATVYVLDHVRSGAGSPTGGTRAGEPLPADVRAHLTAQLASTTTVTFVADRNIVLTTTDGCAHVRNGGILITLGTVDGDDDQVTVGVNGFVACLGATWLTYVVRHRAGTGWEVTGTTGPMAIA